MRDEHGVGKGDRVAICSANNPEWIIAFWATVSLGAIAVGMNSMWAAPEIAYGLSLTTPKVVVSPFAAQGSDGRIYPWGNEWQASAVPTPDKGRTLRGPGARHRA